MADLDQSGQVSQYIKAYLGPTIGWVLLPVRSERIITAAGDVTVGLGESIILLNKTVGAATIVFLPDVTTWIQIAIQITTLMNSPFGGVIYIKDLKGDAAANNITVRPFGTQKIDGLQQDFTIVQNRQLLRLYPLNDLTGWFSG